MDIEKFDTVRDIQELLALREDIDNLDLFKTGANATTPKFDLLDMGDSYHFIAEVPGVPQENLEIALQGSSLTLAGLREPLDGDYRVLSKERADGHFQRTVELPRDIDANAVQAHLREGLLTLVLPKTR